MFLSSFISAQVWHDKVEEDGSRTIIAKSEKSLYNYLLWNAQLGLTYHIDTNGDAYLLYIRFNEIEADNIDNGRKLLAKLNDDSVVELRVFGKTWNNSDDIMYSYALTLSEIFMLINGEVTKIRVETNSGYFDRNIKKNRFSEGLKSAYDAIQQRLIIKNDIYNGF